MDDYMKYDGRFPELAYITGDSLAELITERDRLAAENAELRAEKNFAEVDANKYRAAMMAANATLDRLREVVPEDRMQCLKCDSNVDPNYLGCGDWRCEDCERELSHFDVVAAVRAILYPKETDNG